MKIAISGTHATGKSTKTLELATKLKKENPTKTVRLLQENVAMCPLSYNEKTSFESQLWIVSDQMKAEIEAENKFDIIVCDRSVFDPIAYSYACGLPGVSLILYDFLKHYGKSYDKIYLLDGNKNNFIFEDGVRSTNIEFRNSVNEKFLELFNRLYNEGWIKDLEII